MKELEKRLAALEATPPKKPSAELLWWTQSQINMARAFVTDGIELPIPIDPDLVAIVRNLEDTI